MKTVHAKGNVPRKFSEKNIIESHYCILQLLWLHLCFELHEDNLLNEFIFSIIWKKCKTSIKLQNKPGEWAELYNLQISYEHIKINENCEKAKSKMWFLEKCDCCRSVMFTDYYSCLYLIRSCCWTDKDQQEIADLYVYIYTEDVW